MEIDVEKEDAKRFWKRRNRSTLSCFKQVGLRMSHGPGKGMRDSCKNSFIHGC